MPSYTANQAENFRETYEAKAERAHALELAILKELEEDGGSNLVGSIDVLDVIEENQNDELFYLLFKFWASGRQGNAIKRQETVRALQNYLDKLLEETVTEAVSNA